MIITLKAFQDISQWPTPSDVEAFITHGHYAFGDGGAGEYKRVAIVPSHPAYAVSATGGIFELTNRVVTPEMYGAVGDNVVNDNASLTKMADHARSRGYLDARFNPGKIYTHTNPRFLANIKDVRISGYDSAIRNMRSDASYTNILEMLPLAAPPTLIDTAGPTVPYVYGTNFGSLISTAESGAVAVSIIGTVPADIVAGSRVFIYGFNGILSASNPCDPRIFEYNEIVSVNAGVVTLRHRLKNRYDSNWADGLSGVVNKGAPRIVSLDRGAEFIFADVFEINGLEFKKNPDWPDSDPLKAEFDGTVSVGGNVTLKDCSLDGHLWAGSGERIVIDGCGVSKDIELDKMVETATVVDTSFSKIGGAVGTKVLNIIRCRGTFQIPTPIEHLNIEDCEFDDVSIAPTDISLVSWPQSGTRSITVKNTKWLVTQTRTKIFTFLNAQLKVYSVAGSVIGLGTQAQYETSLDGNPNTMQVLNVGSILYSAAGLPILKVSKLPYLSGGDMFVDGTLYNTPLVNDILYTPNIERYYLDNVSFEGLYAADVQNVGHNYGAQILTQGASNAVNTW